MPKFSSVTQVRLYCDPSMDVHAQGELTRALSTALGTISKLPRKGRQLNSLLAQIRTVIAGVRRRFLQLRPECLWVVVYGSTADTKRALVDIPPSPMFRITELHITPVTTDKNAI